MKAEHLLLIICCMTAVFIIAYVAWPPATYPEEQYTEVSTTYVLNQNSLDVVFPGQNLMIATNDSNQRICYVVYNDAWMPEINGRMNDGMCYDLEGGVSEECGPESDIKINNGYLSIINNATGFMISQKDFESDAFLCSSLTQNMYYEKHKEEACQETNDPADCLDSFIKIGYTDLMKVKTEDFHYHFCIATGEGNFFKYRIKDYDTLQRTEFIPKEMICSNISDKSITVDLSQVDDGTNRIAYTAEGPSGSMEEIKTYTFVKTNAPYSSVSNPNFHETVYSGSRQELPGIYHFDTIFIDAEYTENLIAIWYRCDGGEWQRSEADGNFAYATIDESLCKTFGWHTIYYFAESQGVNGTLKEYVFFQNTERPWAENVSIVSERSGEKYRLELKHEFNSPANLPENHLINTRWYKDGVLFMIGETIYVYGGITLTAEYTPIDITALSGTALNRTITIPNEPPQTRDISISYNLKYPPSIIATGDYYDPDGAPEGSSLYRWYVNGTLIMEGRTLTPDLYAQGMTVEYTPTDSVGLSGTPLNKTIHVQGGFTDEWLYIFALYQSNLTYCEKIAEKSLRSECLDTVDLAIRECGSRQARETFFCLAFLKDDPEYCRYIDLDWYRTSCTIFISGNPDECNSLDDDDMGSCIIGFASSTGNSGLCANITDADTRTLCNAIADKRPDLCSSISDASVRERCLSEASYV